jgi:predicted nucleotidyltransferase
LSIAAAERRVADTVQAALGDVPVLLCGSRATGAAIAGSDFDVLVVLPRRRIPFALARLGALGRVLSDELDAPVTINPLPLHLTRTRRPNLFLWKLQREARLLSTGPPLPLPRDSAPPIGEGARFSYLATAVTYLIQSLDEGELATSSPPTLERGTRKALLHLVQLRLLRTGRYSSTLEAALDELGDPTLGALAADLAAPAGWLEVRAAVLDELAGIRRRSSLGSAAVVNSRYLVLASCRGRPRICAALSSRPVDLRLAEVAVLLARAVARSGAPDEVTLAAARRALPRPLRRRAGTSWSSLRDVVLDEWAHAHPLLAQ